MQDWSDIFQSTYKLLSHKLKDCFHAATHELQSQLDKQALHDNSLQAHKAVESHYQSVFEKLHNASEQFSQKKVVRFAERKVDSLSVLSKQEHSFDVYGKSFCRKADDLSQSLLILSWLRFESLIGHKLAIDGLPNAPAVLADVAKIYVNALALDEEQSVMLFKAILKEYVFEFHKLNTQLNNFFVSKAILAELDDNDVNARLKQMHKSEQDQKHRNEVLSDMAEFVLPEHNASSAALLDIESVISAVEIPEQLEHHLIDNNSDADLISDQDLVAQLDNSFADFDTEDFTADSFTNLADELNEKFAQEDFQVSKNAENTIAMLSMLFDDLAQFHLPEPIQRLMDRLSLPILKTALNDQSFFLDANNPGQQLLNKMAELSVLWEKSDQEEDDILLAAMKNSVQQVNQHYQTNSNIFAESIQYLEQAESQFLARAKKREERLKSLEKAKSRQLEAQHIARKHLDAKFAKLELPTAINDFLYQYWSKTLCFAFNKFANTQNELWQAAIAAEDQLLNYMRDKITGDRAKAVYGLQTQLLSIGLAKVEVNAQLKAILPALDSVSIDADVGLVDDNPLDAAQLKAQQAILNSLAASVDAVEDELEQDAAKSQSPTSGQAALSLSTNSPTDSSLAEADFTSPSSESLSKQDQADKQDGGQQSVEPQTVEPPLDASPSSNATEENVAKFTVDTISKLLTMNTWVRDNRQSPVLKLKLATYIKFTDTFVWVNREGQKVMDMHSDEAVQLLNDAQLELLENDGVFDKALEHVITHLKA
ncbi:MAG: DUF1631 family protein [Pseudomonadales bacterium]|nr:DUF1631 family protein [Pseudomonadales bacterium]